jgi:hypothetical protein
VSLAADLAARSSFVDERASVQTAGIRAGQTWAPLQKPVVVVDESADSLTGT